MANRRSEVAVIFIIKKRKENTVTYYFDKLTENKYIWSSLSYKLQGEKLLLTAREV